MRTSRTAATSSSINRIRCNSRCDSCSGGPSPRYHRPSSVSTTTRDTITTTATTTRYQQHRVNRFLSSSSSLVDQTTSSAAFTYDDSNDLNDNDNNSNSTSTITNNNVDVDGRERQGASSTKPNDNKSRIEDMIGIVNNLESSHIPHPGQIKEAFIYWNSKQARAALERRIRRMNNNERANRELQLQQQQQQQQQQEDDPLEYAQKILDWLVDRQDWKMLEQVLTIEGPSRSNYTLNSQICRMIRTSSWPLQGTKTTLEQSGYRKQDSVSLNNKRIALYKASKLCDTLQGLHDNTNAINFVPDVESYQAVLLLWNRRINFLSQLTNKRSPTPSTQYSPDWWDDPITLTALGRKKSIQECLDIMKQILEGLEDDECSGSTDKAGDVGMLYGVLLSAYAHGVSANNNIAARDEVVADEAYELLQKLEQEGKVEVTTRHYNAVLSAYANEATRRENPISESVQKALDLWGHMKLLSNDNKNVFACDPITMSILMTLLRKTGLPEQTQELLDYMEAQAHETSKDYPNLLHYNSCLSAWGKSKYSDAGDKAEAVLHRMTNLNIQPDRISYTAIIEALLFSASDHGMDRAEAILTLCEKTNDKKTKPDTATYFTFLRGLIFRHRREIESQLREAICFRMESILSRMHKQSKNSHLVRKPIADTYNLVLDGWARSLSSLAPRRAMALVEEINKKDIVPNAKLYEFVLKCLCVNPENDPDSAIKNAKKLIQQMEQKGIKQTIDVFNQYLRVLARTGHVEEAASILAEAEEQSSEIRENGGSIIQPNESTYYALIDGYSRTQNGEKEAERILRDYIDNIALRTGAAPPLHMFSTVMGAWGRSTDPNAMEHVERLFEEACRYGKPNGYLYGTYMSALRQSRRPDAPILIEKLLAHMQQEYESGVNPQGRPNASNFATAISSWASSGREGAAERAESILLRLEELSSNCGGSSTADRYRNIKLNPTTACYRGVIQAWAMSGGGDCGDRAVAILDRMDARRKRASSSAAMPNQACYKYAVVAIGNSGCNDKDKAEKVYSILERMDKDYKDGNRHAQATGIIYSAALRAISTVQGSPDDRSAAYVFAQKTLEAYHHHHASTVPPPSRGIGCGGGDNDEERVYLQFLWAVSKLLPPDESRDEVVRQAFRCYRPNVPSKRISAAIRRVVVNESIRNAIVAGQR